MVIASIPTYRFFREAAVIILALFWCCFVGAQEKLEEAKSVALGEIPDRFFQVQDANGFFWQATANGALTSGETQYLQSGLNLVVDDAVFAPTTGAIRSPEGNGGTVDIDLSEKREKFTVSRNLLFDRERSSVRVLDSFRNTSGSAETLSVALRTTYPFAWQSLHGMEGKLLSSDPVLRLGQRDGGIVVHFSPAEGRHDTLLVLGSGDKALLPKLTGSTNRRELTLNYQIEIPAGETRSLLHWISQRTVPDMNEAERSFSDLMQRGRLLRPGVEATLAKSIVNFAAEAFPDSSTAPAQLRAMIGLNQLLDRVGTHRRGSDLLWLSASNQVAGEVNENAELTINAAHLGEKTFSLNVVAAIKGGGGIGRDPQVFLRNGQVLTGAVSATGLEMSVAGSAEISPLDLKTLNLLLLKVRSSDGVPPAKTIGFVRLIDHSVFPISGPADLVLPAVSSWGAEKILLPGVEDLSYARLPSPSHRVVTGDGSVYSVFLMGEPVSLQVAGGSEVQINASDIVDYWKVGQSSLTEDSTGDRWLDFDDVPEDFRAQGGFLIKGNNLLVGSFNDSFLTLRENGAVIRLESARIQAIRRSSEVRADGAARFVLELKNGESLEGSLDMPYLFVIRGEQIIQIPVEQFFAFSVPIP